MKTLAELNELLEMSTIDSPVIEILINELRGDQEEVQSGSILAGGLILALIEIGESAVNALIEGLEHRNILVRAGAATALGEIGDKRAVMPLIKALEDEDYNVQGWAAGALGKIGDRRAVKPLVKLLKASEEVAVRNAAEGALEKLGTSR